MPCNGCYDILSKRQVRKPEEREREREREREGRKIDGGKIRLDNIQDCTSWGS
jgi:hypothetical protein